jgi:exodeoxyribonuclease VII small subunit
LAASARGRYNPERTEIWRFIVAKSNRKPTDEPDFSRFEDSLEELEKIVERMESGDQSLEESLKDFERGVTLTKACQSMLKNAEQKVEKLVKDHGELKTEPVPEDDS